MSTYFYLTSRLYPCGECATEFQQLLKQFPPQVCLLNHSPVIGVYLTTIQTDFIPENGFSMASVSNYKHGKYLDCVIIGYVVFITKSTNDWGSQNLTVPILAMNTIAVAATTQLLRLHWPRNTQRSIPWIWRMTWAKMISLVLRWLGVDVDPMFWNNWISLSGDCITV